MIFFCDHISKDANYVYFARNYHKQLHISLACITVDIYMYLDMSLHIHIVSFIHPLMYWTRKYLCDDHVDPITAANDTEMDNSYLGHCE